MGCCISTKTVQQGTLMELCVENGAALSDIKNCGRSNPQSAKERDERGRTCLHMAVFFNPDVDIINAVNTLYPQQALMKEKLGFTPLHLACISSKDANFLRAVAELEPEAALEQNRVNTCAGPRIP